MSSRESHTNLILPSSADWAHTADEFFFPSDSIIFTLKIAIRCDFEKFIIFSLTVLWNIKLLSSLKINTRQTTFSISIEPRQFVLFTNRKKNLFLRTFPHALWFSKKKKPRRRDENWKTVFKTWFHLINVKTWNVYLTECNHRQHTSEAKQKFFIWNENELVNMKLKRSWEHLSQRRPRWWTAQSTLSSTNIKLWLINTATDDL